MWQAKFVGILGNSFKYYIICIVLGLENLIGCITEMKNPNHFIYSKTCMVLAFSEESKFSKNEV